VVTADNRHACKRMFISALHQTGCSVLTNILIFSISKAASRLYFLKQMRRADVPTRDLLHFYTTVLPVLDYACPVWHSGLTIVQSDLLESVQKRAIRIVYPDADYQTSLIVAGIDSWHTVRKEGSVIGEIFQETGSRQQLIAAQLLPDRRDNDITSSLRNAKPFYSFRTCTDRFRKSFLPYCLDNYT